MPVFLERFILPVLAAALIGIIILNPFKLDVHQQVSLGIAVVALAYFVGHTVYRSNTPVKPLTSFEAAQRAARVRAAELSKAKQVTTVAYQPEVTFDCPENVSLRIFSRDKAIVAVFTKNGITATTGSYKLETRDYRTFSLADQNWREPKVFMAAIASVPTLEPGHPSKEFVLILIHKNQLEIGNRSMNEILVWPPADPSPIHRYLLRLVVFGSGDASKTIQICIRWERGTDQVELMEYNENIPASAF